MEVQRITPDPRIKADANLIALQYGPLIYNVETVDQHNLDMALSSEPLQAEWRPDLLGGVMVITGKWQDGTPMLAIPNYARMNRVAQEWSEVARESSVNYAPDATTNNSNATPQANAGTSLAGAPAAPPRRYQRKIESEVWMKSLA